MTAFSEPVARFLYGWFTGADATSTESIQVVGGFLITITLCIASLLAVATSGILFLVFFPTDRYRRWVTSRANG